MRVQAAFLEAADLGLRRTGGAFSDLLPRAAMFVYHGGVGTLAQPIKAGIPHLVVPNGHDQFDNGWLAKPGEGVKGPAAIL